MISILMIPFCSPCWIDGIFVNEITFDMSWHHLLQETNSHLVTLDFKQTHVPLFITNGGIACIFNSFLMHFKAHHIFREGNHCANKIVCNGLSTNNFNCGNSLSVSIWNIFNHNRLVYLYMGFVHFVVYMFECFFLLPTLLINMPNLFQVHNLTSLISYLVLSWF
jgi:hypothetical protein